MATSGTVATTTIDTALVVDHAVRRCGLSPSTLTPEQLDTALHNLYLILTSTINRGVNLWCVEQQIVGLYEDQKSYTLADGTIDVLNAQYRTSTALTPTETVAAASWTFTFTAATAVKTVGILFGNTATYSLILEYSSDNVTYTTARAIGSTSEVISKWKWYDIDPAHSALYFRIRESVSGAVTFTDVILATTNSEVPMDRMSRDTYTSMPSKNFAGRPLQYFYDKQTTPTMTLWPVPDDTNAQVVVWRQRQVQDVGSLSQKLEIPERWFESVIWSLSQNLAFELPDVKADRLALCTAMAGKYLKEAEDGECDSAPIFITPNLRAYTI